MQEDVERVGDEIVVKADVDPGEFIRRRGCDLSEGQKIISKGERISATTLALLASQGIAELMIGGDVTTSILSTGDELARPGTQLEPGQIFESNSILLAALLQDCGAILKSSEHCRDDRNSLRKAIERGISNRILIVTGGVSVGDHDLVREILRELGATIDIWRVAIKPGKPFLFGRAGDCAIFGLPGNPVSAFVTFLKLVRPAILKMMGANQWELGLRQIPAQLSAGLSNDGDRVHYVRGRLDGGRFTPVGRQESHAVFGLSQANAIARIDPGAKLEAGEAVIAEGWD
jgi:molybdopterin molybdotransferase